MLLSQLTGLETVENCCLNLIGYGKFHAGRAAWLQDEGQHVARGQQRRTLPVPGVFVGSRQCDTCQDLLRWELAVD